MPIAYLEGQIIHQTSSTLILKVGQVGYEIGCSTTTLQAVSAESQQVSLWIETLIRQEAWQFIGFATLVEKNVFLRLIQVQGVGSKLALSLLSRFTPNQIYTAVQQEQSALLTQADGVGLKMARRLITELQNKLPLDLQSEPSMNSQSARYDEASEYLNVLGFENSDIQRVLGPAAGHSDQDSLEHIIRRALALLSPPAPAPRSLALEQAVSKEKSGVVKKNDPLGKVSP